MRHTFNLATAARISPTALWTALWTALLLLALPVTLAAQPLPFRAGAATVDITPKKFPVRVNGGFTERTATRTVDPLYARALALDDGRTKIVLCVVDTCMMPRALIDRAKAIAAKKSGVPAARMMVSATHTHSAPSAMGCLGTRVDAAYALRLPNQLAAVILRALARLTPARIGWSSVEAPNHTFNRRWIFRNDHTGTDPYGDRTVHANMHPGHRSRNVIGPSGPVDSELSVLAVQTPKGQPLALFANYSQHYFGSGLLSADYYGAFCRHIATRLGQASGEGPFVAMMSQGTSGDLMWMDYGAQRRRVSMDTYARELTDLAMRAYSEIEWHDHVPLDMVEKKRTLRWRVPDEKRLAWARRRVAALGEKLPRAQPDIYAHETLYLHEAQQTELKLQAIRIGGLGITTLPNEVYAITGLKLKARSPFEAHFNISLANGAQGYIPPPEQHALGGYTTWAARTAGLETRAEPVIVDTLLEALEEIAGNRLRGPDTTTNRFAQAVRDAKAWSHWKLEEHSGDSLDNAVPERPDAKVSGKYALYLTGAVGRAVHLVDGRIDLGARMPRDGSIALWCWLGARSGASERDGELVHLSSGDVLRVAQDAGHRAVVSLGGQTGPTRLRADEWHFVVLVREGGKLRVYLDGNKAPELEAEAAVAKSAEKSAKKSGRVILGQGLQGKLDEIVLFDRALGASEIASLWQASGLAERRAEAAAERQRAAKTAAARAQPPVFAADHVDIFRALRPVRHAKLDRKPKDLTTERGVTLSPETYAAFDNGRIRGRFPGLGPTWSTAFWFRNDLPKDARPVTAYLFSRGPDGDKKAPGDHLGIGGVYRDDLPGRLMVFNGNDVDEVLVGKTVLPKATWNHVVLLRDGRRAKVWLNGKLEIDGALTVTAAGAKDFYLGARSDSFAPLQGYVADFALFDRALSSDEVRRLFGSARPGKIERPAEKPTEKPAEKPAEKPTKRRPEPESPPLSVDDALRSIRVPEGFTVELVAAEPQVLDPVAFDWDSKGRLFVAEMADYPMGMDNSGSPGGRVRTLEDRDGDGRFEHATLFATDLAFPSGILTWRDGVIITAAPHVIFLRDTDGDGKADHREVLLTGLTEGNQQLRANGLRWGLDNRVYVAAGGHHGKYGLNTKIRSTRAKTEVKVGSRDFRFDPDTGVVEPQSGPTQYGRNRDDWGRWFGTQNAHPLWHYVLPDHYLRRNPYLRAPDGRTQILGTEPRVYPASRPQKRFHSFHQSGRFTSACSGMIYRDEHLFPRDEIHGFVCEPFHNLVQRIRLRPDGVTFAGARAGDPGKDSNQPDFFASRDRWCRPVMVRTGPDGALWVADMYRYMIEHPQWLPKKGRDELLPFYRAGEDRGRIYRVRRADRPRKPNRPKPGAITPAQLASTNGWTRDKVQQELLWRGDRSVVPALRAMATDHADPRGRLHALCTLDGLDALEAATVTRALADPHPGVRENALRLAEPRPSPAVRAAALRLVSDPEPRVRLQLAFSLGAFPPSPEVGKALAALMAPGHLQTAVLSSALPHLARLVAVDLNPAARLQLAEMVLRTGKRELLDELGEPLFARAVASDSADTWQPCIDLLDLLARRNQSLPATPSFQKLLAKARSNEDLHGAALLARVPSERARAVALLAQRLQPATPPDDQRLALDLLAGTSDATVPGLLLDAWPGLTPQSRGQVLDKLLSRNAWTAKLLDALDRGALRAGDFDPVRKTRLLKHPNQRLRARASERLAIAGSGARAKVVDEYRAALKRKGDIARGRAVFGKTCAACHRRGARGAEVGPDLRGVKAHSPEKILIHILDPNRDIQPGHQAYTCTLTSGEQLYGTVASENASGIVLESPDGKRHSVLRRDIRSLQCLNISLMPEGLESAIDLQGMADLIAFLKSSE